MTPFVAMESVRVVIDRIFMRGLVVKAMGPAGVNDHAQQVTAVPGSVKIQSRERIPRKRPFTHDPDPQNKR